MQQEKIEREQRFVRNIEALRAENIVRECREFYSRRSPKQYLDELLEEVTVREIFTEYRRIMGPRSNLDYMINNHPEDILAIVSHNIDDVVCIRKIRRQIDTN